MTKATIINNIKIVGLALILAAGMSYAFAWTAPTATPPAGNVAAPINTSVNAQLKNGPLGVNGYFTAYSGMSANSNLIKDVATPIDGTDAVNKDYVDAATGGSDMFSSCGTVSRSLGGEVYMICVKPNGIVCRTGDLHSVSYINGSSFLSYGRWTCSQ